MLLSESQNSVSEGEWPGPVLDLELPVPELQHLAVAQGPRDPGVGAPAPEAPRHRAERDDHVLGDAMRSHQRRRVLVVELGVVGEVLEERDGDVDRGDLGSRALAHDLGEAEVVEVLVGEDDELDRLERVPELGELALELVQGLPRVRAGVDERQRVVVDQIAVDPADGERRWNREAMDARFARPLERLGAGHERMTARTSSRLASMSSRETSDSRLRRRSGSVLEGRTLKCQSG